MLFLTTTIWNVWFLRGVRARGQRSDSERSGLPATGEVRRAASVAGLRSREFSSGILSDTGGGEADSILISLLLGWGAGWAKSETGNKRTTEG